MRQNSYKQTISELYQLQQFSVKQGLDNILRLSEYLGHPEKKYPVLHVAGTNGKGSTSVVLQKILIEHGFKTGLYTSPHLIDFRERIRIDDNYIGTKYIKDYWEDIASLVLEMKATFFDTTTALAFKYFADNQVDVAIIETGLGGRLDSTNIVDSFAAILTPIHRDHTKQLGLKLKDITTEKADIVKKNSTVFCGKQHYMVYRSLNPYESMGKKWHYLTKSIKTSLVRSFTASSEFKLTDLKRNRKIDNLKLNLAGSHQIDNASLAYITARWFVDQKQVKFEEYKLRKALAEVQWPGRFQLISSSPGIIFDVSHNYDGFRQTMKLISRNYSKNRSHLLIGLLDDKEYIGIARLISGHFESVIITEPKHERPLAAEKFSQVLRKTNSDIKIIKDYSIAYQQAREKLKSEDTLFVMGSHFLIGSLMAAITKRT